MRRSPNSSVIHRRRNSVGIMGRSRRWTGRLGRVPNAAALHRLVLSQQPSREWVRIASQTIKGALCASCPNRSRICPSATTISRWLWLQAFWGVWPLARHRRSLRWQPPERRTTWRHAADTGQSLSWHAKDGRALRPKQSY